MTTVYRGGYAEVYDRVMLTRGRDHAAQARAVAALVRAPERAALLDVACGTGLHLEFLRARFREVSGLDAAPEMLAAARARVPGLRTHLADLRAVDLPDRFDVITCLFAVAHLEPTELAATVRRLVGHLRPAGVLVVEPWYAPEEFVDGYVARDVVDGPDGATVRLSHSTRLGPSRIRVVVHYAEAHRDSGLRHSTETAELSLFTPGEFASAFEAAGCVAERVDAPPFAWGLWVARA